MALGTEFTKIAVTDAMLTVLKLTAQTNDGGAEDIAKEFLRVGGMGMVRAKGPYHSEDRLAAIVSEAPTAEEERSIRAQCLQLAKDTMPNSTPSEKLIAIASSYAGYVLTGKKPGEA